MSVLDHLLSPKAYSKNNEEVMVPSGQNMGNLSAEDLIGEVQAIKTKWKK
jgi:hypothetical protein